MKVPIKEESITLIKSVVHSSLEKNLDILGLIIN